MTHIGPGQETRKKIEVMLSRENWAELISEEDVLTALREEGVTSLEELVKRVLDAEASKDLPSEGGKPIKFNSLAATRGTANDAAIKHIAPQMALTVDGVEYEPRDISLFDGKPLHFIPSRTRSGEEVLHAFTDHEPIRMVRMVSYAMRHLNARDWPNYNAPWEIPLGPYPTSGGSSNPDADAVQMWSDIDFGGDWFWCHAGRQYTDLRQVPRHKVLFWSSDWNDVISSVSGPDEDIIYYEHIDAGGSTLNPPRGVGNSDLRGIGWNDRISCVQNWGRG